MSDETNEEIFAPGDEHTAANDGLAAENIGVVTFIQLSRIYDVLLAILADSNEEMHLELLQAHAAGLLLGPSPVFQGRFLTDEQNG